ncbi:hypothetical protein [Chitinophaga silvisoli]|uniref:Uncharacterized protein n=1 Tax=Chitinophaga silvisoli TaxID=2291814 RepID=A0A3E1NZI1_9BACT|nr:hypothetical protein [Chitinophaga silvisoli]RFM33351.1 hypothetical protein DXN04_20220 [Chitinophaga silvisoli]
MKYLLLPLFTLCCSITFGQNLEDAPFKGANKVLAAYSMQGDELFSYLCQQLLDNGYTPDKMNREFHFITTEEKNKESMVYVMRIYIKGDIVEYSAREASAYEKSVQAKRQTEYGPNLGLFSHNACFNEMVEFIMGTKPQKVRYSR